MQDIITGILNGKPVPYHKDAIFLVQTRDKRKHRGYVTKYSFKGDLSSAVWHFNCINTNQNFTKRIFCESLNKPVLVRL